MGGSYLLLIYAYRLGLLQFSTLYILEVWATDWVLFYKVVFLHLSFFSPFCLGALYMLFFPPFSIFCFIHPHTLKDCEESVPAEEPRKSMDHWMCDRACDLLCTVDCMSGHLFLWMLQLYLLIYFSTFCNWIPCKTSKLRGQNRCLTIFSLITASHNYPSCSWDAHFVSLIWSLK